MGIKKGRCLLLALVMGIGCIGSQGDKMSLPELKFPSIEDIQESAWLTLADKKIYFGHQSVGFNIVDGIKDVMKGNPQIKMIITETDNAADFDTARFGHSRIGKNGDAKSKMESFAILMEKGLGNKVDIAFLKFCYVDVTGKTDIRRLFEDYKKSLKRLKQAYPRTTFIHVTIPLTSITKTWKTRVKEILMRDHIWEYDDNIARNDFNKLLFEEFIGKEPLFDIAGIESTGYDGKRSAFKKAGKSFYSLAPEYTQDGGHLNETGRKRVAEQLLIFLAGMFAK